MSGYGNTRITIIVVKHADPSPADRVRAAYREERRQIAKAMSLRDSGQLDNSGYRKRLARIGKLTDHLVHNVEPTDALCADLDRILEVPHGRARENDPPHGWLWSGLPHWQTGPRQDMPGPARIIFSPQTGKIRKPRDYVSKEGDHSTRNPFTQRQISPPSDDGRPSTR